MNVLIDLRIVPVGVGVTLSCYVAAWEQVPTEAGAIDAANGTGRP